MFLSLMASNFTRAGLEALNPNGLGVYEEVRELDDLGVCWDYLESPIV